MTKIKMTHGSTNVFADLGFPDAAELQAKLKLAFAINNIIAERKLTQAQAAQRLEVNQPKISALAHYKLEGFSIERLMNFLTALDRDVDIIIRKPKKHHRRGRGEIRVAA